MPARSRSPGASRGPGPRAPPLPRSKVPKSSAPSTPTEKDTLPSLFNQRKLPLVGAGLAAACLGLYLSSLAISVFKPAPCAHSHEEGTESENPTGRPPELREGKISAGAFDASLDWPEWLMGITKLRRIIGGMARGHVLEIAVGTGRNLEYYDWQDIKGLAMATEGEQQIEQERERKRKRLEKLESGKWKRDDVSPELLSFTGVDISTDVLEVSWGKLRKAAPELISKRRKQIAEAQQGKEKGRSKPSPVPAAEENTLAVNLGDGRIRLFKGDAQASLPAPPSSDGSTSPPTKYDTIVQTFGLCSVADPSRLLAEMAGALQPNTGRIILLEHGRGWYDFVNSMLDKYAPSHFQRFGCWWNRDIEGIVRAAAETVPGLEVVRVERPYKLQAGTMLWIELQVVRPGAAGGNSSKVPRSAAAESR